MNHKCVAERWVIYYFCSFYQVKMEMWIHVEQLLFWQHSSESTGGRQTWCPQSPLPGTWLPSLVPDPLLSICREIVHLADPQVGLTPCPAWTSFPSPAGVRLQSWPRCMKILITNPHWGPPPPLPRACLAAWVTWQVVDVLTVGLSFAGQMPHAACPSWLGVDRDTLFHLHGPHGQKDCVRGLARWLSAVWLIMLGSYKVSLLAWTPGFGLFENWILSGSEVRIYSLNNFEHCAVYKHVPVRNLSIKINFMCPFKFCISVQKILVTQKLMWLVWNYSLSLT